MSVTPARDVSRCLTGSTTYSPATRQAAVWPPACRRRGLRPSVRPSVTLPCTQPPHLHGSPTPPRGGRSPCATSSCACLLLGQRRPPASSPPLCSDYDRCRRLQNQLSVACRRTRASRAPSTLLHDLSWICLADLAYNRFATSRIRQSSAYTTNRRRRKAGPTDTNRSATSPQQIRVMQFETHS